MQKIKNGGATALETRLSAKGPKRSRKASIITKKIDNSKFVIKGKQMNFIPSLRDLRSKSWQSTTKNYKKGVIWQFALIDCHESATADSRNDKYKKGQINEPH